MKQKVVLYFSASMVEQPIVYHLVKDYDLVVNILRADISRSKEGRLVLELSGDDERYQAALDFLRSSGVRISPLKQQIVWNEERCTQCGACSTICPSEALVLERPSMLIRFQEDKCVVCEYCLKACPARAMEARY